MREWGKKKRQQRGGQNDKVGAPFGRDVGTSVSHRIVIFIYFFLPPILPSCTQMTTNKTQHRKGITRTPMFIDTLYTESL